MKSIPSDVVEVVLKHGDGSVTTFQPKSAQLGPGCEAGTSVEVNLGSGHSAVYSTPASFVSAQEMEQIASALEQDEAADAPSYDTAAVLDSMINGKGGDARKKLDITQEELADVLGVNQSVVSRVESNPDRATLGTLKKIAGAILEAARRKQTS